MPITCTVGSTKTPLAKLRALTGLTYTQIAKELGMTPSRVRHAAIGELPAIRRPAAERAARLSRYRISAEEFRFGRLFPRGRRGKPA